MMNKAINTLVLATVDSLTKFKNKLGYYLAIFAMVFGSTFGSINSANANPVTLANGLTAAADDANGDTTTGDAITSATRYFINGATGNINAGDDGVTITSITSITADSATDVSGAGGLTVTGDIEAQKNLAITIDTLSDMTIGGSILEESGEVATIIIESGAILTFNGDSAQDIAAAIDSNSDAAGVIALSGSGTKTFADVVGGGGSDEIATLTVAAATTAEFNGTLDATAITNLGTLQIDGASNADTITNSGTLIVNNTLDDIAASGDAAIVMHTAGSVLTFNASTNLIQDVVITATTDSFGTINVLDSVDGAPASTTTAGGDIGASGKKIGTINIGSATKAGSLNNIDGDAIFAAAINITGGNVDTENSIINLNENIGDSDDLATITLAAAAAGDAEIEIDTVSSIFGTIDSASGTDGAGDTIIDVDAALTMEGNIGATVAVEKMQVGDTTTLKGATNTIESIDFSADDILAIGGSTAQTITGTITNTTLEHGEVNVTNTGGLVTFDGQIGTSAKRVKEIDIADNADVTFKNAIFANTLDINTAESNDIITFEAAGSIIGDLGATDDSVEIAGGTIVLGTAIQGGSTVIDIKTVDPDTNGLVIAAATTVKPSASFQSGVVKLFDGVDTTQYFTNAAELAFLSVTDNALTSYAISNTTALTGDTLITATAKSAGTTASEMSITTNSAKALHQAVSSSNAGSDSSALSALSDNITSANSGTLATATDLSKQIAPQDDMISGSTFATKAMTGSLQGIMSNRMASLRSGDAFMTGMSAGNGMSANSGFIQAFGTEAEQKNKTVGSGTQFGYDASSAGLALGFDGITDNGSVVGLSFSMSNTDVDGKGTGNSKNDIDSYTVSVYADKTTDAGYIEGSLTVGLNENNSSRIVNTAGLNRTYNGDYDSEQVSLKIGGGMPNAVGTGFVTPYGSVTATRISTDAYTETSTTASDSLRLRVAQDDVDSIVGTVGLKYHTVLDNGGTPMISLAVNNEFGDNTINSTNTYQGGGTAFNTSTDVEELSATLGLGYSFRSDNTTFELAYEADANDDDYLGHYGSIKIVSKF